MHKQGQLVLLGRHYGQRPSGSLRPALSPGQLCVRPDGSRKQLGVTWLRILLPALFNVLRGLSKDDQTSVTCIAPFAVQEGPLHGGS